MQKAKAIQGTRFIHLWVTCPAGYKSDERYSIKIARLAVETGMFPLYEVENGTRYTINRQPAFSDLTEYLNLQGRFRHLVEAQIETMRRGIKGEWKRLRARVEMGQKLEDTPD
jgi:pyruvate/2-oxoacid:ferredoxin oxidoreductase beta subunit